MTDPKHDRIMAAARSLAVDFAIRIDGMSVDEANAYFKIGEQAARVSQTITDALALAAAEGANELVEYMRPVMETAMVMPNYRGRYRDETERLRAEVTRLRAKLEVP